MAFLDTSDWFRIALQLRGSVLRAVWPRTLLCTLFALLITILYQQGLPLSIPVLVAFVPNIVLGLLLVFRTNTAYDRFWEGRKWWGSLVNDVRNLVRHIWVSIDERTPQDRHTKITIMRLLPAYAIALKLHLRGQSPDPDLQFLVSPSQFQKLHQVNSIPLEIAFWIGDYLQQQYHRGHVHVYQLTAMIELLDSMVDALGACERILKTPIPLAYTIHLKQLLLIYALSLPFQMVDSLVWLTAPIVGVFSFILLGIEEIGIEIENPFGMDPNDLPLDAICQTMQRNVEDMIQVYTPS